ncbi:MAG: glycosyltransferase family 2 protein [Betaproteobacteria bacterium]|nr:glycosyltransferase family 2 protein [Betaproteobacteria bacterium]
MQDTLIVIPAKNEAATISGVIAEVRAATSLPLLLVDDGSADDTAKIARAAGAIVLTPPLHLGAWGAIQTGLRYALERDYRRVVTLDADGQHEARWIPDLLAVLDGDAADLAIGAFPERGSAARQVAWALFRRITGLGFEDLTSGFRAYNAKAIALLAGEEATLLDYQDVGVLLLARSAKLRIVEVPVKMRLRTTGPSRIFSSWWVVTKYMLETVLLCFAHWNRTGRQRT